MQENWKLHLPSLRFTNVFVQLLRYNFKDFLWNFLSCFSRYCSMMEYFLPHVVLKKFFRFFNFLISFNNFLSEFPWSVAKFSGNNSDNTWLYFRSIFSFFRLTSFFRLSSSSAKFSSNVESSSKSSSDQNFSLPLTDRISATHRNNAFI